MEGPANDLRFPKKLSFLFKPARYKVAFGGRGSGKSWGFARALLIQAQQRPLRILCARELQLSITESVHRLLSNQIEAMRLSAYFEIQGQVIKGSNGSEFIFTGIKSNPEKIKSTEAVDICWVEEAETVSERSWEVLIPTIRNPGSEIWVSFNPHEATDPTYKRFVLDPPPGAVVREINWADNKWFPQELKAEKDYLARVDPDTYEHIWNGKCRTNSDAQIFKGKYRIEAFDPPAGDEWDGPYFGADWGFSNDPTTLVKCWIRERTLFVEHEAWGIGINYDDIAALFLSIPGADNHVIRADNSQPGHIAHVSEKGGLRIEGADKWPGSVEDGVQYLRSFEAIVVHPRCVHAAEEFRLYSYKQDRLSGDILPIIVDKHNHVLDGLRYSLSPMVPGNSAIASFTKIAENRGFERFYTELGYR
jgi:phage terminase large subunit